MVLIIGMALALGGLAQGGLAQGGLALGEPAPVGLALVGLVLLLRLLPRFGNQRPSGCLPTPGH